MKLSKCIALRVSGLLAEKGINQYSLYKNGGIPRSTISDVVNNNKKRVSTETIYQICSTIGISLADFFNHPLFNEIDD